MLRINRLLSAILFFLLIYFAPFAAVAQNTTVTGKVTGTDGKPLENVSVIDKATGNGTATAKDGTFKLNVNKPSGNTLLFTSVGFADKQVDQTSATVSVQMEKSNESLEAVVVVGYGTQKRKDITGSIVSVDKQRLEDLPNTNFVQSLEGSLPGVSVTTAGGGAEGNNVNILIRGQKSIKASTDPLIILDGIPYNGSYSDINPTDIASIDILKDASSAAIYGSRGSNGVIIITTKKGSTGKPVVSYDGFTAIEKIANLPDVLSPEGFYQFKVQREGQGSITSSEQEVYDSKNFPNWLDMATRTGSKTQHSLGIRGGNSSVKYYASATYLDVKGVALNDNFKRLSTRINLDVKIADWLDYGTNTQLTYNDRAGLPASFSGENGAYFFNPLTSAYDSSGKLSIYPWPQDVHFGNPLAPTLAKSSDNTYKIFSTNYLLVKIPFVQGLSYRLNTGIEYQARNISSYYGRNTLEGLSNNGSLTSSNSNVNNYTVENILTYDRTFNKHSISFTGLYSFEKDITSSTSLDAQQFPSDVLTAYQPDVALAVQPHANYAKRTLISQMARINYSYDGRYLLTLTGRRDGSSVFGENNKYAFFPIVAVGWNIANESFMANSNLFSNLKLRLSYGSNGNQAISPYETLAALTTRSYIDGVTTAPGYVPKTLDNPDLKWETTNSANIGLDFGILKGRVQGTIEYYDAHTHDLLLDRQISPVQGISTITQNIGKTSNRGFELALNTINIQTKDFTWTTNANLSINRNKIEELYGDGKDDTLNQWFIGHPIKVDFGYVYGGVWQEKEDTANTPQGTVHPGSAKIIDINSDGTINSFDRTILGRTEPSFIWGMANTFKYKGFSLYIFMHGVQGRHEVNTLLSEGGVQSGVRHNTVIKNWWTPSNPTNDYFANSLNANKSPSAVSLVENSSFIRITDISLGYNFSENILKKIGLTRLKLYVEARNPFTITDWTGLDPELGSQTALPLQKEYVFGLNVSL
jgi:TonB-linked SusC/RagA family outer membrane protein